MTHKQMMKFLVNIPDDGTYINNLWHNSNTKKILTEELEKYKKKEERHKP